MAIFQRFIHHNFSSRILSFFHQFLVDLSTDTPGLFALKIWIHLLHPFYYSTVMFVLTISLSIDISPFHILATLVLLFSAVPINFDGGARRSNGFKPWCGRHSI